jgi:hypothetical protein
MTTSGILLLAVALVLSLGYLWMHRNKADDSRYAAPPQAGSVALTGSFSQDFVACRDSLHAHLPENFSYEEGVTLCGKTCAFLATFDSAAQRKFMGLAVLGDQPVTHAFEYRLLFAVPHMTLEAAEDFWQYGLTLQQHFAPKDSLHDFTMLSLVLICGEIDADAAALLKRSRNEIQYQMPLTGWSHIRLAAVDLPSRKLIANEDGRPLAALLRPLFS